MRIIFKILKWLIWMVVIAAVAYGIWWYVSSKRQEEQTISYRTAKITRMDIFRVVEATGTVQPIKEVEVGAQVNGRILRLFVDYNSIVTNGQVVALIDPQVYEANYRSALGELHANEANVDKFNAQLTLAEKTLERKKKLADREMAPVAEYDAALEARDTAKASLAAAKASVEKSMASVSQARANLEYCTIVSPVNGIVIDRSVDEGQTVVSSMNAVPLFNIATDLKRIQVEATVPEADIGNVHDGQEVTFRVDSYPGMKFKGCVTQVRMASTTTSSVVTYPVIIEADNPNGKLYPGMTANLSIHISEARNVLAVTSAAFRYHPPGDVRPVRDGSENTSDMYLLEDGEPKMITVEHGLTDGSFTEIKVSADMDGKEVVLGMSTPQNKPAASPGTSNPFMPRRPNRPKRNSGARP